MDSGKVEAAVPVAPVTSIAVQEKGFLKRMFGHFSRPEFWEEFFSMLVRESIAALISAIGGTLVTVAAERRSAASNRIRAVVDQAGNAAAGHNPGTAFSGGYQPQPTYRPSYPPGVTASSKPYPGY